MEVLQPLVQDIRFVLVRFDSFFVELSLCFRGGSETVLRDVVSKSVGRLRVEACGFEVGIADLVPEFLEVSVGAGIEVLVQGWLVAAVFYAEVDDFFSHLCVGEVEGGGAVEFYILGGYVAACFEYWA
jgi:hypothetical protein